MSLDREELNKRRRAREEQRKKRQAAQRRLYLRLALAGLVLLACGLGIFFLSREEPSQTADAPAVATDQVEIHQDLPKETAAPIEEQAAWVRSEEVIHIAAAGDLNITDQVIWSGQNGSDYDYTKAFRDVAPIFSGADLALLNFEGNACGTPYDGTTTSAPLQLLTALKNAGIDLLQMANSCTINNGHSGLQTTLANIRSAGIEPVGAFSDDAEYQRSNGYTVVEVNGIKIVVVAFTKGLGGKGLPAGTENCVNLLYKDYYTTYQEIDRDGIRKVLKNAAAENPDLTIALLHWGSEYNDTISDSQEKIRELMQKNGVDVIIGNHPHMVHQIDYDEKTGSLVAYSLGDFFGDGSRGGTNYSIILDLEITKNYETGETRVTDYSYTPIYTLSEKECDGDRRVVRIENAMSAYDLNFVDKITDSAYESMTNALSRIAARVDPEAE